MTRAEDQAVGELGKRKGRILCEETGIESAPQRMCQIVAALGSDSIKNGAELACELGDAKVVEPETWKKDFNKRQGGISVFATCQNEVQASRECFSEQDETQRQLVADHPHGGLLRASATTNSVHPVVQEVEAR